MELRRAQFDRAAGFTLLELAVVLAILGLTAAIVIPSKPSSSGKAALDTAAAGIAAALRNAKAAGLRHSTDQTVTFDLEQGSYWSDADPQVRVLGPRIGVTIEDDGFEWAGRNRVVRIRPGGSATGGTIMLDNGTAKARVALDWLTGSTRLSLGR
jgi:general secretion pathway protein H